MISRWQWLLLNLSRRLWLRAALFCLLAIFSVFLSPLIAPFIPAGVADALGGDAVDRILDILASSLLAVTTFSLTVMVASYGAATSNVTPRATRLLREDTTTQNVLSTFIGSFLFSLVGIVALSAGAYGDKGRVVLFAVTIVVIAIIVLTILRWIEHLTHLGQVGETTARVEEATLKAFRGRIQTPCLGGRAFGNPDSEVPESARPVYPEVAGYVQHLDIARLSRCADAWEARIFVTMGPGKFVHPGEPMAWVDGGDAEDVASTVRAAFTIGDERSFDQDPRFGFCVLAEIATRALSPAMNDQGTAIDVIGRAIRILNRWPDRDGRDDEDVAFPNIWIPPLTPEDFFEDLFQPIARDCGAMLEVHVRLQKAFLALCIMDDEGIREAAQHHSQLALKRAEASLVLEEDKAVLRQLAARVAECVPRSDVGSA